MIADRRDLGGEKFGFITSLAARALIFANVKDLIHSSMEGIGFESIADLINERENDVMYLWMPRTIAFAIEFVGIGPGIFLRELDLGRLIKFRVNSEELPTVRLPRLMAEQIDQRHDPDLMFPANRGQLPCLLPREPSFIRHFRPTRELKTVVDAQNENIDRPRRQSFLDEFNDLIQ